MNRVSCKSGLSMLLITPRITMNTYEVSVKRALKTDVSLSIETPSHC